MKYYKRNIWSKKEQAEVWAEHGAIGHSVRGDMPTSFADICLDAQSLALEPNNVPSDELTWEAIQKSLDALVAAGYIIESNTFTPLLNRMLEEAHTKVHRQYERIAQLERRERGYRNDLKQRELDAQRVETRHTNLRSELQYQLDRIILLEKLFCRSVGKQWSAKKWENEYRIYMQWLGENAKPLRKESDLMPSTRRKREW